MIGDAACRLGDFDRAREAYRLSAPRSADAQALLPRSIYADLCTGRPASAQYALLEEVFRKLRSAAR